MGVITVSEMMSLVSVRKGSVFKKIAYSLGLTMLGQLFATHFSQKTVKGTGKKACANSKFMKSLNYYGQK
jgi:hypothetical protein